MFSGNTSAQDFHALFLNLFRFLDILLSYTPHLSIHHSRRNSTQEYSTGWIEDSLPSNNSSRIRMEEHLRTDNHPASASPPRPRFLAPRNGAMHLVHDSCNSHLLMCMVRKMFSSFENLLTGIVILGSRLQENQQAQQQQSYDASGWWCLSV